MTCMLMVNFSRATSLPFLTVFVDCARFGLLGPVLEHMVGRPCTSWRNRSAGRRNVHRLGLCDWDVEKYGHSTCVCSNKLGAKFPLVKHGSFRRFWWLFLDIHPKLGLWRFKGSRPGRFALVSGRCSLGWRKVLRTETWLSEKIIGLLQWFDDCLRNLRENQYPWWIDLDWCEGKTYRKPWLLLQGCRQQHFRNRNQSQSCRLQFFNLVSEF